MLLLTTDAQSQRVDLVVLEPKGIKTRYDIGTPFDSLHQSGDGKFVIAHYSQGGNSTEQGLLFNPSEIAIVDLSKTGESAVTKRTLRSPGSGPRSILFSPPMDLVGETRQLAVVVYDKQIAILDLNHPERPEYTVELSGASISVKQVKFSVQDQKIYVLAQGSNDVFVIRLLPAGDNRENDFEPSRNQLGTDSAPLDMAVFEAKEGRRLLVASGNRAEIVEASSSRVTSVPLSVSADHVYLFHGRSPFDDTDADRALLYSAGQSGVTFVDLEDIEQRTTRNLEVLPVPSGISQVVELPGNRLLLPQTQGGMTIVDLEQRTASSIQARINLTEIIPSNKLGRLWTTTAGGQALAYLDVDTLHPGQVNLDYPISNLFVLEDANRVVAVHPGPQGIVTLLDATNPQATDHAVTLDGFFAEGALDR
jgi:hypothetical protein